jgi:cytochrome P450
MQMLVLMPKIPPSPRARAGPGPGTPWSPARSETIRAGEGVIAALPAANWDPLAFPEPEKLDLARRAAHHVAFSWGPHQCIGQQLARIELRIVFGTLFRRVPTLRLAVDVSELKFKEDSQAYGIYELPVTW